MRKPMCWTLLTLLILSVLFLASCERDEATVSPEVQTNERREGIFYGVWALLTKLTAALGIAVSGWALDLFGYVPNVDQTETARLGIRLFFGLIPSIAIILSLPLLVWYPITRKTHAQVREQLHAGENAALPEH